MDAEVIRNILLGVNLIFTVGMYVFNARDKKELATIASINRIEENANNKIQAQDVRVAQLERDIRHAPTHDHLSAIYDKLNEAIGQFKEMRGEFRQSSKQAERLYQRLGELESGMGGK